MISPGIPMRFHLKDLDMGRDKLVLLRLLKIVNDTTLAATSLYKYG